MILSRKIELKPNNRQQTLFRKHIGTARHAWNWGLRICIDVLEIRKAEKLAEGKATTKFPSSIDLQKRLVAEVKSVNPWYYDSSKSSPQQALRDLESAFKKMHKVPGTKFPRFKKRGDKESFALEQSPRACAFTDHQIRLPKIGWMRTKESIPANAEIKSVTISHRAGRWFMAFKITVPDVAPTEHTSVVGVDLGIRTFASLSTGETFTIPQQKRLQKKLVRLQRQHARRQPGSGRRKRTRSQIAAVHYRIANVRKDATHKLTNHVAKNHGVTVIEDLCVSGMMKNHCLAASIAASNFSEIRRQLVYKCEKYGSQLVVADRWFPSSQLCSGCGHRQKMLLKLDRYDCPTCGLSLDRDVNAAKNLAASSAVFARQNTEVHALNGRCGDSCVKNSQLLTRE